jgi:anionic cell wall polymer biosynthesis LytR-Cps2A-Psr (LCP) family protein
MLHRRPRSWAVAGLLALVVAGTGGLAGPVSAAPFHFSPLPWLNAALDVANMFGVEGAVQDVVGQPNVSGGSDGRITVLLLGTDYRAHTAGTGERTDSIIFMTIDNSNRISAISLPRDVGNVPIGPGQTFGPKINGLFKYYKQQSGGSRNVALDKVRQAFQYAFQIQIDYVAFVRFTGLVRLVDQIGGVGVNVPYNIYDSRIIDTRIVGTNLQQGAKFLSGYTLEKGSSAPDCYTVGNPINWNATPNCSSALLYVRSRHGPGNSDWKRARRQQSFIFAAMKQVAATQLAGLRVSALSNSTDFYTTLPMGSADVLYMYNRVHYATMPNQAVLQPPTYASNVPGTQKQELKIDVVRALFHSWFGPLN